MFAWFGSFVLRELCFGLVVLLLDLAGLIVYFVVFNSVGNSLFITWSLLVLLGLLFGLRICV